MKLNFDLNAYAVDWMGQKHEMHYEKAWLAEWLSNGSVCYIVTPVLERLDFIWYLNKQKILENFFYINDNSHK